MFINIILWWCNLRERREVCVCEGGWGGGGGVIGVMGDMFIALATLYNI